jgi:hypothetical protein
MLVLRSSEAGPLAPAYERTQRVSMLDLCANPANKPCTRCAANLPCRNRLPTSAGFAGAPHRSPHCRHRSKCTSHS